MLGGLVKRVCKARVELDALVHFLERRVSLEHALSPSIISAIEAGQEDVQIGMTGASQNLVVNVR